MDHKLRSVIVHLTNACSNKCPYCYAYKEGAIEHAKKETILRIIDELYNAKVKSVTFLGGDPLLHPNIYSFIKYAYEKGLQISIMSNSMNFNKSLFDEIAQMISTFETTIHGYDANTHDNMCRNFGAYQQLVSNLKHIASINGTIGIAINIIPTNADYIYNMIESLLKREGIKISYIIIQRIVQFGKACGLDDYKLNKDQANVALEQIDRISTDLGIKITVEDPFPLCVINEKYHKYMNPCEWGFSKAAVNIHGDLSRCGADPRCLLGNILKTPISDIWENSPILQSFRNREYLPETCRKCSKREICGGGCPLSCEANIDHGIDYLFEEYHKD